jgi:hypothetical protein
VARKAGWRAGPKGDLAPTWSVRRGPDRYAVEVMVAREPRRSLLQVMFADAILHPNTLRTLACRCTGSSRA